MHLLYFFLFLFFTDIHANAIVESKVEVLISEDSKSSLPYENELEKYVYRGASVINIGDCPPEWALHLSKRMGDQGQIHLFFESSKALRQLKNHIDSKNLKNLNFHKIKYPSEIQKERNSFKSLDSFNLNRVSLIRIAADHQEMTILKGALQTIVRDKPALLIYIPKNAGEQKIIENIENLGYSHLPLSYPDSHLFISNQINDAHLYDKNVTIAILAKDKAHVLPLYLSCIEMQNWPTSKTNLYIRTNNNNDATSQILREWVDRVGKRYATVYFDDSDVAENVQQYKQHEWNAIRFKVLGKIRQDSVNWAKDHDSHYFVVDCDNFIHPDTLSALARTHLPIVAPFLRASDQSFYSNYHSAVDANGYMLLNDRFYHPIFARELKGLINLPVVHCTYFIQNPILDKIVYDDNSGRYEYVIFSDQARKQNIPQYLDNRRLYGRLTFAETPESMQSEGWLSEFWYTKFVE